MNRTATRRLTRSIHTSSITHAEREAFGLPPVKPKWGPRPTTPPPPKSIILDPAYRHHRQLERERKQVKDDDPDAAWRLDTFGRMAASPKRECMLSHQLMPNAFMLNLRPGLAGDKGDKAYLLPDRLQHPSIQPRRTGQGGWIALHPSAVEVVAADPSDKTSRGLIGPLFKGLSAIVQSAGLQPKDLRRPAKLKEMVADGLRKRVVQELDIVRSAVRGFRGPHAVVPLGVVAHQAVAAGKVPTVPDGRVVAVLDMDTKPAPHRAEAAIFLTTQEGAANVPHYRLHDLFKHREYAAQVTSHVRDVIAADRQWTTVDLEDAVAAEGYVPQADVDHVKTATEQLEAHEMDDEARLVALVVPSTAAPGRPRDLVIPTTIALWRVALHEGIGWEADLPDRYVQGLEKMKAKGHPKAKAGKGQAKDDKKTK